MFRRSKSHMRTLERGLALAVAMVVSVVAGGCDDYLERRDTITLGVGDAIAVNKATQTINRWPAAARQDRWVSDGERARIAVSRYRRRDVPDPKTLEKSSDSATDGLEKGGATTGK